MAVHTECLVKLLKKGCSYREIGFQHVGRQHGRSKALSGKNILATLRLVGFLVREVYFQKGA